jgi:hypothetical protein
MTGAEAIQQILEAMTDLSAKVKTLQDSVNFIEANIKILNNRAAGLMITPDQQIKADTIKPNALPIKELQLTASAPIRHIEQQESIPITQEDVPSNTLTYKKVFGKLINNTNEPIENVLIKVYDKNNEVCATAETDAIGYWESMLRPGRYVAEYLKSGFKTANKTFEVGKNAKDVEVK